LEGSKYEMNLAIFHHKNELVIFKGVEEHERRYEQCNLENISLQIFSE